MANPKKYIIKLTGKNVIFGPVDTSYMHVVEKWAPEGADNSSYSVLLLIPKTATAVIDAIKQAIEKAIKEGISSKWNGKKPSNLALPLKDGDDKEDPDFHGYYVMNAKNTTQRPGLGFVRNDAIVTDNLPDEDNWYSGNKVLAFVNFFPYKASGNVGVSCWLDGLALVEKGERKGGSPSIEKAAAGLDLSGLGIGEDAEDDDL